MRIYWRVEFPQQEACLVSLSKGFVSRRRGRFMFQSWAIWVSVSLSFYSFDFFYFTFVCHHPHTLVYRLPFRQTHCISGRNNAGVEKSIFNIVSLAIPQMSWLKTAACRGLLQLLANLSARSFIFLIHLNMLLSSTTVHFLLFWNR